MKTLYRCPLFLAAILFSAAPTVAGAGGFDYWAAKEAQAHGDLEHMLAIMESASPIPQLRLNRSAADLSAALERAGRFEALGLSPAEGRILVRAFYRRHGLDPAGPHRNAEPVGAETTLPADYRAGREFDPLAGVLLRWPFDWPQLRDEYAVMVDAILKSGAGAVIWVDTWWQRLRAGLYLTRRGVDPSTVTWVVEDTDSVWMRDYGPLYLYGKEPQEWGVVDFHYYDGRPNDDDTPLVVADGNAKDVVDRQFTRVLYTEGGNINTDGLGSVLYSRRTYDGNFTLSTAEVDERIVSALNADNNIVLQDPSLDATGHVDMFSKIVSRDTILVARHDPDETDYQVLEDNALLLQASVNGDGTPWNVVRIRQPDVYYQFFISPVVRTYTNSLIVNDRVIVPVYGIEDDAEALAVYAAVFPDKIIVPLDANDIIEASGAWHCVTMEFPAPGLP